ncbi:MAG: hypothetical protein RIR31_278 [Bacteroidota bacterium]|jgi:hypothetical protein
MPFTFSHPAVILPLCNFKKQILSVTGLIVGSIIPDFEFLMRMRETESFGHTWLGILVLDIPLAIILTFVFHGLVRNILIQHLPKFLQKRFLFLLSFNWTNYFKENIGKVLLSLAIGIFSHVFLDAFTHYDGFFVLMSPFFFQKLALGGHTIPMYLILQICSSVAGGVYVLWFVLKMKKAEYVQQVNTFYMYWIQLILLASCILAIRLLADRVHLLPTDILIACIGSFLYALFIISLYYKKREAAAVKN